MNHAEAEGMKVRMRVVSRMRDPEGAAFETKSAHIGRLCEGADGLTLEYDDEQDGERAHILLTVREGDTPKRNRARMQRRGMMSGTLSFLPGQRAAGSYVSIYGEIPVAVDTRRVEIERTEKGGTLLLDYDVYMGGERTSGALLDVTWRL